MCAFLLASCAALLVNPAPAEAAITGVVVNKIALQSTAQDGDEVDYQVTISVTDDATADGIAQLTQLRDDVPGEASINLLNAPAANNSTCSSVGASQAITVTTPYTCTFEREVDGDGGDTVVNTVFASVTVIGGASGPFSGTDTASIIIEDEDTDISVTKTASPQSLPAPGGTFTYTVVIRNNGDETVDLVSLTDDRKGSLTGFNSTCNPTTSISANSTYTCSFTDVFNGANGATQTNTVTAVAEDPDDTEDRDTASDSETVSISAGGTSTTGFTVTKTANPTSRPIPGGTFTFTVVSTNNTGSSVTLNTLTDNVHGGLDGKGSCDTPQTIANGSSYSCTFAVDFTGNAAKSETDTVTATATAVTGGASFSDTDDETISITGTSASPSPTISIPLNPLNPFNPFNPLAPIGSTDSGRGPIIITNNNSSSSSSSAAAAASGGAVTPATPKTLVRTGVEALPMAAGGMAILLLGFVMLSAGNKKLLLGKSR